MSTSFDRETKQDSLTSGNPSSTGMAVEERRVAQRTSGPLSIQLTTDGCPGGHSCSVSDISEEGLYLSVPSDSGLCVGQRCEVTFGSKADSPEWAALQGEARYATVVRTAKLADGSTTRVGAGLRFDQRLYL